MMRTEWPTREREKPLEPEAWAAMEYVPCLHPFEKRSMYRVEGQQGWREHCYACDRRIMWEPAS